MSTKTTPTSKPVGTNGRIAGPFVGFDKYGHPDYEYHRCTRCGAEAVRERDLYGCC